MKGFALKGQYEEIRLGSNSVGVLRNTQPGFDRGGVLHVVSVLVDFVF